MSQVPEPARTMLLGVMAAIIRSSDQITTQMARSNGDKDAMMDSDRQIIDYTNSLLSRVEEFTG